MKAKQIKSGLVEDTPRKTRVIVKKVYNRGQYKIVGGSSDMIEPSTPDNRSEDEVLNPTDRARMLDLTRNLVRNSSLFNTILGQMTTNVVSTVGGKVVLNIPDDETNEILKRAFSSYTRNADFYLGSSLNHMLKRILREYVIGGECVLVFDDNLVEDSGKVLVFESNEIVNVPQNEIESRYGKGSTISQGKVYSPNGRHIGTVVSKSQKGLPVSDVDPKKCYYLKKDPNANPIENYWFQFSNNWREGRAVSQASSAIGTLHQLEDLVQSELMSARRNSQLFCWLTQNLQNEDMLPSAFDTTVDFSNMTDEEVEAAVQAQNGNSGNDDENVKTISFLKARENNICYEQLPDGVTAQQLQTTHPNTNIQIMVDWLANRAASTLGLSKVFATGNPEDTNWRSNQLFSYPAIVELQKDLEVVLDWLFYQFVKRMKSNGAELKLDDDFMSYVDWEWKSLDSLDPVAYQTGIRLALQNRTKTYREILGNDWKTKLSQTAYEHKWMLDNGITPVDELMISGGQTEISKETTVE